MAKEAGCEVAAEEVVPELLNGTPGSPEAVEARLDLHIWSPQPDAQWFVDVTHHHSWASRWRQGTLSAGKVAAEEEKKKVERYGPGRGGIVVTPAAVESWGRLGSSFEHLLRSLEAQWAKLHATTPAMVAATGRRWRCELGIALARAQHVAFMRASRCAEGVADMAA
jgi:hypothetical protein